jgi:hypothetical protein
MSEAPLISKALRLLSLALIVGTVALVATVAYSGMQEFGALAGTFSSASSGVGGNNGSTPFTEQFNGSTLLISGINVPNNMSFPLDFQLSGFVGLGGIVIGNFSTPVEHIMPGQTAPISIAVPLNYTKALSNQSALTSLLLNSMTLTFETKVTSNIVPLLGLNLTSSQNTKLPPVLGNFNLNPGSACYNCQNCSLPIGISWNNPSPISFNGEMNVNVTQIQGVSGPYPSASISFAVKGGSPGSATPTLVFPCADAQPGQQIGLAITFNAFGTYVTLPENVTIP